MFTFRSLWSALASRLSDERAHSPGTSDFGGLLRADVHRYFGRSDGWAVAHGFARIPGFRYTCLLRAVQHYPLIHPVGCFARVWKARMGTQYGFQIPDGVRLGAGFYIGHFGTIILNQKTVIGKNCNIAPHCTIGQANRGSKKGVPVLGDCVWIGVGSTIVGKINVGNNVLIAPGSYVNEDVPANSLVMGNPAVIRPRGPEVVDGYINRRV